MKNNSPKGRRKDKKGVGITDKSKGKSSYTQGEQFLQHVDCAPSNEDVYENDDFGAQL